MCNLGQFQEMRTVPEKHPIGALRSWDLTSTGHLKSLWSEYTWTDTPQEAKDSSLGTRKLAFTDSGARWGFYAHNNDYCFHTGAVEGVVALHGQVAVYEHGYRAQFATPRAVYVNQDVHNRLMRRIISRKLRKNYRHLLVFPNPRLLSIWQWCVAHDKSR